MNPPREFERVWRGFMTARVTLGLMLVLVQGGIFFLSPAPDNASLLICAGYLVAALVVRLKSRPQQLGNTFDAQWLRTVGVDVLTFATLQVLQNSAINYTPLLALPVLMTSILGTRMLAMGAAAAVTLLLFAYAAWLSLQTQTDSSAQFVQAALTGAGCFAISFIASQMASGLASVERSAQRSQLAATVQKQVNELVIESLSDGIMVVDELGQLRSANPAARLLLGNLRQPQTLGLDLNARPGWLDLAHLVARSFTTGQAQQSDIDICHEGQGQRCLWVRTQLTAPVENDAQGLCVVFMQDQREVQARIRAEKLASMGRMSAAVAHEIRNPLAAITQANALLAEELHDPAQQRLASMVQQNAQRLEKIVRDVLHLTHAPSAGNAEPVLQLNLPDITRRICSDWTNHHALADTLALNLPAAAWYVTFDPEHLRRVLINLLDNARRYASGQATCIQVDMLYPGAAAAPATLRLRVWSDGAPLDPSVEQHLFEPFFSSESRSSGLGLYISRELCESHGATMLYVRNARTVLGTLTQGNEFSIEFKSHPDVALSLFNSEPAPAL
jgi:two-component system sensor histidine kinase PilS (NtrC family)